MLENLLAKVRVVREGNGNFGYVSRLIFYVDGSQFGPDKRNDYINCIIYLGVADAASRGIDIGRLASSDVNQILTIASEYFPEIFYTYCQIFLIKKGVSITPDIEDGLKRKIASDNLPHKFTLWVKSLKDEKSKGLLNNTIAKYSFSENVEDNIIERFSQEFIPINFNVNVVDLTPGLTICNCSLTRLISKKENSQVWEAVRAGRKVCVKFQKLDLEEKKIDKLIVGRSYEKIIDYIRESDTEFLTYQKLHSYPYKVEYFDVDYYHPLRSKIKIMSWLNGPIDTVVIEDKKNFIFGLYQIIFELHKLGIMYNSINMSHIMIKPNEGIQNNPNIRTIYRLIDFNHVTEFKGENKHVTSHYISLPMMTGNVLSTPYDDIESLLFLINDVISSKVIYTDQSDENNKKSNLSGVSSIIAEAIQSLRVLRQNDEYANSLNKPTNYTEYIEGVYNRGITINNGANTLPGIQMIFRKLHDSYNEVSEIEISLTKPDYHLLNLIKKNIAGSSSNLFIQLMQNQVQTNQVCLAILNYQIYGYEPHDFKQYIKEYFGYV